LNKSDLFDPRLKAVVIKIVDTSYGGENGFNQAIELSKEALADVKFVHEKKILANFLEEIAMDTNKYAFGVRDTMRALEMSAIKTIVVWDDLDIIRFKLRNPSTKETSEKYISSKDTENNDFLKDNKTGVIMDILEQQELLEWLAENYKSFGAKMEFVTDRSQEGAQFVKGFGGIGAFLRWQINWAEMDDYFTIDEDDDEAWI
jgi:peptide chain release factor subunit 1